MNKVWIPILLLTGLALTGCTGIAPSLASAEYDAQTEELEFTAPVDSVGSDAWSIGGLSVGLTVATEIVGEPQVGDMVKVHAMVVDQERLVAREIELVAPAGAPEAAETPVAAASPGSEIEFFGNVVEIGAGQWTVGDRVVAVTTETEVKGPLSVGDLAKVHAIVQPDGTLTAREIEAAALEDMAGDDSSNDDGDHLEFRGTVENISADTWLVAGMSFQVLPGTEIKDLIVVGDFVKVEAVWSTSGVLTAVEIELEDENDDASDDSDDDADDDSNDDADDDSDDDSGSGHDGADDSDDSSGSGGSGPG